MKLSLKDIGKRYNYEWVFQNVNLQFESGRRYAILGPNGSGKSTLLQIIAGSLSPSQGKLSFTLGNNLLAPESVFQYTSMATPYLELIEELSLEELLSFHRQFKPLIQGISLKAMAEQVHLGPAFKKPLRYYSSGMKQRARLAQAFFSDVPVLLLDEPCANLDDEGFHMYQELLTTYARDRLVIICSNNPREYEGCQDFIKITDYK